MQSSDLARKLGGCRITSCKSAKDRTSMSITHEETRLLPELPREHALQFANVLREFGVRVANGRKNTGKGAMRLTFCNASCCLWSIARQCR